MTRLKLVSCLAMAALCGCSSYYDYRYQPALLESELRMIEDGPTQGRALVSVVGVRRADDDEDLPAGVEIRIRLENLGGAPFSLDTDSLILVSADLQTFAEPRVSATNAEVPPGEDRTIDLYFPFAGASGPGDVDMDGLNLRWTVRFGDESLVMASTFDRVPDEYYDDGYRTRFFFGFSRTGCD